MVAQRFRILLLAWCALASSMVAGCGRPPQVTSEHLQLISSLRTALSAENEEWLDQNEQVIQQRHAAGEMSDEEHAAFARIIATARQGEWDSAEKAAIRFQQAQRPKQDLLERNPRTRAAAN